MVFGTGMNYKLSRHWALRAEYRGLFYKNPDWSGIRSADTNVPTSKLYTVTNEPTISLVYRFGRKR
jgi:opacity protein-like surface antigen